MTCKGTNCTASRENGFRHSSECLFDHARSVASGVASVSYGVTLDDSIDYVEWRGKRIDLEAALSAHGQTVVDEARPMDTYVSGLALIWMPEFDHYAAGWWKGSVISGITRLQTPFVQDDKQLWLEMTDMQPLGWMPLPEPPTFLTGATP